jgi:uncharacterized membrane protein YgaE (UPF0421/DUF939 family)
MNDEPVNLDFFKKESYEKQYMSAVKKKSSIIETVNDQLKNISQIEHTCHRSSSNFLINLLAGIAAYTHQPKKSSINFSEHDRRLLIAA